jgi:uncharacterized protein
MEPSADRETEPTRFARWRPTFAPRLSRRNLALGLFCLGGLVASWLLVSLAVAHRLTQRNRPPFPEPGPTVDLGQFESLRLKTQDGHELGAWLVAGEEEAPSILLLHGNGGSRSGISSRGLIWASNGFPVLMVSLRAHGDSSGDFNDIGYGARNDVIAAVDFLERRRPGRPILIHGKSMGAAAAIFAAGDLGHRIAGYIFESPYQDLRIAVRNRTRNALPTPLDWIAYRGLLLVAPWVLPDFDKIAPVKAIEAMPADVPVLILAGGEDPVARPEEARAVFERVRSHGQLVVFDRGGHMNFLDVEPERYKRLLLDFATPFRSRTD